MIALPDTTMTVRDVAQQLQTSERNVLYWLKDGKLSGYKVGREWRISQASVRAFLNLPPVSNQ